MLRNLKISIIKNLKKKHSPFHNTVVPEKNQRSTFIPDSRVVHILLIYSIKTEIMTILV